MLNNESQNKTIYEMNNNRSPNFEAVKLYFSLDDGTVPNWKFNIYCLLGKIEDDKSLSLIIRK